MQQQLYLHLHKHGIMEHGLQLLKLGQRVEVNVDLHVIQITYGMEIVVKLIQGHNLVEEVSQKMHQRLRHLHIHRHGMEALGLQLSLGQMELIFVDGAVMLIII